MASRNKSGGLRYLWIPGRKKSHPKGRFDSTHKQVKNHSNQQKPNEPWSLGGSKMHKNLLEGDDFESSSPSISGIASSSFAAGIPAITCAVQMPAPTENKFVALAKIDDMDELPSPPKNGEYNGKPNYNYSASDLLSNSVLNHNLKKIDEDLEDDLPSPPGCDEHSSDVASVDSSNKKHLNSNNKRSNNNIHPEVDVNSIESISECKLKYSDLDLTDGVYNSSPKKNKKKKKDKNKNSSNNEKSEDEDEKIVKCLYYTLMCCECTIS